MSARAPRKSKSTPTHNAVVPRDVRPKQRRRWWLYLLTCQDGRTYAGIALDVQARFKAHVSGKAAKFTRSNRPVAVLGARRFGSKSAALKAEHALKRLCKLDKLAWARRHPFAAMSVRPSA